MQKKIFLNGYTQNQKKMNSNIYLILLIINFSCSSQTDNNNQIIIPQNNQKVEIYLIDNLDDSRGYCLDMKGYKENADTSRNMQVHTCYSYQGEIAVDQGFNKGKIAEKEFYISHFKVCLEAENIESSSTIELNSCDKNQKQKFILQSNGKINPEGNINLCLTASVSSREGGGGNPVHLIRDLSLELCNDDISTLQRWNMRTSN